MSIEVLYLLRKEAMRPDLKDLDDVVLVADATTNDGFVIPAGTEGTIVGCWPDEDLYTVEFASPVGALATVPDIHLKLATLVGR